MDILMYSRDEVVGQQGGITLVAITPSSFYIQLIQKRLSIVNLKL